MFRFGLRLIRFWLMVSGLVYLIFLNAGLVL